MANSKTRGLGNRCKRGMLFVLSGPSGSGKTTLAQRILKDKRLKGILHRSVSVTTRPKRRGEIQGRDYFFVSDAEFKKQLKEKKILEWTRYLGYYYGTPKRYLDEQLKKGRNILLCLDIRGAKRIKRLYPKNSVTIFIEPPSLEVLSQRLKNRSIKTDETCIKERIALARSELQQARLFQIRLINEDLNKVVDKLRKIILSELNLLSVSN